MLIDLHPFPLLQGPYFFRSRSQCFEHNFHAIWRFHRVCIQRQDNKNVGSSYRVSTVVVITALFRRNASIPVSVKVTVKFNIVSLVMVPLMNWWVENPLWHCQNVHHWYNVKLPRGTGTVKLRVNRPYKLQSRSSSKSKNSGVLTLGMLSIFMLFLFSATVWKRLPGIENGYEWYEWTKTAHC